jgi:hypothetical protein
MLKEENGVLRSTSAILISLKITKIGNKSNILFLATQLGTKIKVYFDIKLRVMEYTAPLSLLKSVTEAFRY